MWDGREKTEKFDAPFVGFHACADMQHVYPKMQQGEEDACS